MKTPNDTIYYNHITTPIGKILLTAHYNHLTGLYLERENYLQIIPNQWQYNRDITVFKEIKLQLGEYFIAKRKSFIVDYKLHGTDFQIDIWKSLIKIPYGEVCTYKAFTSLIAHPNATRAVASAIAKNPLPIILPCHRVIKSDGSLGGYSGGITIKRYLLILECNKHLIDIK